MPETPTLRWYQRDCLEAIWNNLHRNPVACLPTGSGKSHVIAELCKRAIQLYPVTRVLVVAHVKELLEQNAEKIRAHWPQAPIGLWCAGLNQKTARQITVASIQSVYNSTQEIGRFDFIVVDEAHRIPHRSTGMYRQLIADQNTRVVGLTATPYRMTTGMLHEGPESLFDALVYDCKILPLIAEGFLSPILGKRGSTVADLSEVHIQRGEFKSDEMEGAFQTIVASAVSEILELARDRKSILVFAAGVDHARKVTEAFCDRMSPAAGPLFRDHSRDQVVMVTGETGTKERESAVAGFRDGSIRVLVNCDVFTTGFDAPNVDCIALLRATQSPGLYAQMCGRGLRIAPGKESCLLLDYGDNIRRHGPLDEISAASVQKRESSPNLERSRMCPSCGYEISINAKICPHCGYRPEPIQIRHDRYASDADPMKSEVHTFSVTDMVCQLHEKEGKPPSMKVSYSTDFLTKYNEWVCFEHGGYAAEKARLWASFRGVEPPPSSVDEALRINWPQPSSIRVKKDGKYWRVIGAQF